MALADPNSMESLDRQLQQAQDQLQAIKNHQAVNPISIFHWDEPRLWLLLLVLIVILIVLGYIRRRSLSLRTEQPAPVVMADVPDEPEEDEDLTDRIAETPLAPVVKVKKPRKRTVRKKKTTSS